MTGNGVGLKLLSPSKSNDKFVVRLPRNEESGNGPVNSFAVRLTSCNLDRDERSGNGTVSLLLARSRCSRFLHLRISELITPIRLLYPAENLERCGSEHMDLNGMFFTEGGELILRAISISVTLPSSLHVIPENLQGESDSAVAFQESKNGLVLGPEFITYFLKSRRIETSDDLPSVQRRRKKTTKSNAILRRYKRRRKRKED